MFMYLVDHAFRAAGITCNGPHPWDPCIHDSRFYRRVFVHGSVGLGESYMEGWWTCERLDLFIEKLLTSGLSDFLPQWHTIAIRVSKFLADPNDRSRSLRVAHEHYDTDPSFFRDVLGEASVYTCARWKDVHTLDEAQTQKMDLLCRKVHLRPGHTILDIGSGWGGFLAHAAQSFGANGIGLSISQPQIEYARMRYRNLPLDFRLEDYRDFTGAADRAVSICMIEHVGSQHLRTYFEKVRAALPATGIFALQCIIANKARNMTDPWLNKHIFPGGALVTMKHLQSATRGIFHLLDSEYFGDEYVRTLTTWCTNLRTKRDSIVARFGIEHFRKYEYYLLSCAGAFMSGRITVGQQVYSPTRLRDYVPVRL